MALNPALTTLPSGELFPSPFTGEYFALQRNGIDLELKDLPPEVQGCKVSHKLANFDVGSFSQGSTYRGRGKLILSTIRAVFIASDQRGGKKSKI